MNVMSPKKNRLAEGLNGRTCYILWKKTQKMCIRETVFDREKRSKTPNKLKPIKNK